MSNTGLRQGKKGKTKWQETKWTGLKVSPNSVGNNVTVSRQKEHEDISTNTDIQEQKVGNKVMTPWHEVKANRPDMAWTEQKLTNKPQNLQTSNQPTAEEKHHLSP